MSKVFLHISLLFLINYRLYGQTNLLYNGDFEMYDTCPSNVSDPLIEMEIEHCLGWKAPTWASSDYFNACNSTVVGIPSNTVGYQNAKSGNGYCGFLAYSLSNGGCYHGSFWWEYIQGEFTEPLTAENIYYLSFYVCLAEVSNIAVRELGFYVSSERPESCSPQPLNLLPQITSPSGLYLQDTAQWLHIGGYYLANGGEKYITIGNFKDSVSTDTLRLKITPADPPTAYYYIDAGKAENQTEQFKLPNIFTPNGDGLNDLWRIGIDNPNYEIMLFNRWGNLIRQEGLSMFAWDGTDSKNNPCCDGVYFYVIRSKDGLTNSGKLKGFVQLAR